MFPSASSSAHHTLLFFSEMADISHPHSLMLFLSGKGLEFHIISLLTLLARRLDFLEERSLCDSRVDPDLVDYFQHLEEMVVGHLLSPRCT